MARTQTKIGDVFAAMISETKKRYFQYVANDLTQLNSDVIRAFKREHDLGAEPELSKIVKGEVEFYAHCVTKWGLKMGLWEKVGNIKELGDREILFRCTNEYGTGIDEEPVKLSDKWHVWKINGDFEPVGLLDDVTRRAYVGLVINPRGIIELLKGNKYPPLYPD